MFESPIVNSGRISEVEFFACSCKELSNAALVSFADELVSLGSNSIASGSVSSASTSSCFASRLSVVFVSLPVVSLMIEEAFVSS